ncbi:TetR/AcrR family transcriptional regulator [Herbiconiux moechotypicola]|uniref:TetR family transcriptional regulator n=1 Tax=Herbiconiux moechotypicola TaxID=637393 RepID=A0ABN3DVF6_9MICO|nr:TetR/AcrR family transcriptional regulator [Herbiconiux moechotypicola]MCS5730968.1 TetR/AcrR family transcriptional regulator [Herbiconiux moechotypicola]
MARWEPGTRDRLRAVALELFAAQGFEVTTTAEIAAAAGVTERTYFRHFADKREVLFGGQEQFQNGFVEGIVAAVPELDALGTVAAALTAAASFFPDEHRAHSRVRQSVIVANPALLERESLKMAALGEALGEALRRRGHPEPEASLAAQTAVTVFGVAFRQWLADGETRSLVEIEAEVWAGLRALVRPAAGGSGAPA